MIKASAGIFGIGQGARKGNLLSGASLNGWLNKTRLALRHFVIANKNSSDVWEAYILHQQEKARIAARHCKDEIFYRNALSPRLKSIPRKTWKRHSAFLIYRQQMQTREMYNRSKDS